jgi:glycosyltransferase involved in cell wall biosynthesis
VAALLTQLASEGGRVVSVAGSVVAAPGARMGAARRAPGEAPELTVVIPTLDAASERVRACVAAVQASTDAAHDIVLVDNGAPPQGFTRPVNAGLRAARGAYAVVMNDDVEPLPGWWPPLRAALDAGASVAFPLTVDGPMRRDFAAWCFALGRDTLERFGHAPGEFFDPRFTVWFQDTDLLHALRDAGRAPVCVEESRIRHGLSETVSTEDPELRAWIEREIARDLEQFVAKRGEGALPGRAPGGAAPARQGGRDACR